MRSMLEKLMHTCRATTCWVWAARAVAVPHRWEWPSLHVCICCLHSMSLASFFGFHPLLAAQLARRASSSLTCALP